MEKDQYKRYADAHAPRSPLFKDCTKAFLIGGVICVLGQLLREAWERFGYAEQQASLLCSVTLVFLAAMLTALGVFDKVAKHAGAGTLVPITGFSNAVASSAIDSRAEGWILGVGSKIFTVAGPVLLYGIVSGAVYGLIYWVIGLFA